MRTLHAATLVAAALLLGGCSAGNSGALGTTNPLSGNGAPPPPATAAAFRPLFQVALGIFPYPTDLFLNGSVDGTVSAPVLQVTPNVASVNALDGFGVNGEITVRFSKPINAASLAARGAVTVLETRMLTLISSPTSIARVPIGVRRPLFPGVDYTVSLSSAVDAGGQVLSITPLKPLTPSSGGVFFGPANPPPPFLPPTSLDASGVGYLVILTAAITATDGTPALPDNDYAAIRTAVGVPNPANPSAGCATAALSALLQAVCGATAPHLLIAAGAGIPLQAIALTFSFTTESTRDTLVQMATGIENAATPAPIVARGLPNGAGGILTTKNILDPTGKIPALIGNAGVYEGTITLPYYLPTPADATAANPAPPLNGQWLSAAPFSLVPGQTGTQYVTRYNPTPAVTHMVTVPLLMTIPNTGSKPAAGWPVVIFVHGLEGNRTNALYIAESYARAGIAVAAIDLPLHGIPPGDPFAPLRIPGVTERTFDADYRSGPGNFDPSGINFLLAAVESPITGRDNLRQGIVDELALAQALPAATVVGGAGIPLATPFDSTRISLSGLSLGAIIGTSVASLPSNIQSFGVSVPGGLISDILLTSPAFTAIPGAIAAKLGPNTLLFRVFFRDAQAAVDAGDPVNHVALAAAAKPLLLHKVVSDGVVPNTATDRLIALGALLKANTNAHAWPAGSYVTFTRGVHSSLLNPQPVGVNPLVAGAVTQEMQTEFVEFAAVNGAGFAIVDKTYVEP